MATKQAVKRDGLKLLTIMVPDGVDIDIPDEADIIHEQTLDLDEPNLSTTGNSYKAADGVVQGEDAPTATVRIDGKVVKAPLTIRTMAFLSKKAVDKAMARAK